MKKIKSLTDEQKSRLKEWSEKWIQIGLSTDNADFDTAFDAAMRGYKLCGYDSPIIKLKVDSPYAATIAGVYAVILLKFIFNKNIQVRDQVWHQINDQVRDQVWHQINDQVRHQVSDQINDQVRHQVRDQVRDQVNDQVNDQVWKQVSDQVRHQVRNQVRDQVNDQVRDQVWHQINDQVNDQVWKQVRDQVNDQVWKQVRDQVWHQINDQINDQVRHQARNQVRDQLKYGLNNDGISSLWCSFTAFATFFRDIFGWGNELILEKLKINEDLVKSCGWTWWHKNVLVISDRPEKINLDKEGRLHCETGASIAYRDGWSLYHWHGVSIPKEWVTGNPPSAKEAMSWPNIEQRRAACEIVKWANILKELNYIVIDSDDPEIGELIECDIPDSGKERFLKVQCGTKREFVLPVPSEMKTALEANAATYGLDEYSYKPEVRT